MASSDQKPMFQASSHCLKDRYSENNGNVKHQIILLKDVQQN